MLASATDLTLIIDAQGKVLEVSLGEGVDDHPGWQALVGKAWKDTVARDSQPKVDRILAEIREGQPARPRELNQKVDGVGELPFRFTAFQLENQQADDVIAVVGRDLRALATLQQRLVTAQQTMDREYARLRQADTRYRVLFSVATEGVLVADATRTVIEANPAASTLFGEAAEALQGKALTDLFAAGSRAAVQELLAAAEAGARPVELRTRLVGDTEREVFASALYFRQAGAPLLLLRLNPVGATAATTPRASRMLAVLDAIPDGFVVTGEDKRILSANAAFCDLVQQANESHVLGEPLERWLGRPGVDMNIILANLREHGSVRNFATVLRGTFGHPEEALVTAVAALDGKVPCYGFTIRSASSRMLSTPSTSVVPRSIEQLRELVGRVPLKELVRESADLIEKLCIEAALDVSGNNRASAAQLLGLSRQGFYSKLRRHGLSEFGPT